MDAPQETAVVLPSQSQPSSVGRPCEFCINKESILDATRKYILSGIQSEKQRPLFLNELAIVVLKKHRETIMNWADKKNAEGELEHKEFFDMIKEVQEIQELQLQKRILGRYNPTGAIFLLKTKHGYIETEKKVVEETKTVNLNINTLLEKVYGQPVIESDSTT